MKSSPVRNTLAPPAAWINPRRAADAVVAKCRQSRGFQAEHDFWMEFRRIYAEAEITVQPEQRFAFATEVDGRLARMGLSAWSIMSHLRPADGSMPSGQEQ